MMTLPVDVSHSSTVTMDCNNVLINVVDCAVLWTVLGMGYHNLCMDKLPNGPITIAIRARFDYDSTTIRLQHAKTRYEVFRALAYEIVYENQW